VTRSFYKGIAAVLLVYAIDGYESFEQLENWMKEVNDNAHKETIIWLIGTKLDLEERRKVAKSKIEGYSKKSKAVGCMEVSATTGENVK
jgi:GTPase SAR1 family protein